MEEKNEYVVDLFQKELDKRNEQQKKKINKYKKQEEKKRKKELKRLEKEEDIGFAKQQRMSRISKYQNRENNFNLALLYKIFIIAILFITLTYFIYSLIINNMGILKSILFTLMILSFILSSTIQKKNERKIAFIIASSLAILWMLMNL